jgi:hypothetical protein
MRPGAGTKMSLNTQALVARSDELEASQDGKEHRKLRLVALHIVVIVLEFANGIIDPTGRAMEESNPDLIEAGNSGASAKHIKNSNLCKGFNKKIFFDNDLFSHLIKMSASQFTSKNENSDINVLSADELKLVCRAFAAMNP